MWRGLREKESEAGKLFRLIPAITPPPSLASINAFLPLLGLPLQPLRMHVLGALRQEDWEPKLQPTSTGESVIAGSSSLACHWQLVCF